MKGGDKKTNIILYTEFVIVYSKIGFAVITLSQFIARLSNSGN